jgi:hypothetical protein
MHDRAEQNQADPVPAWYVPLAWGVLLPTLVCLVGYLISVKSRTAAGYFLLLWPLATIAGMGFGSLAQMRRLFRTSLPTALVFLAGACIGVAFLAVQAALAVWLGSKIKGP